MSNVLVIERDHWTRRLAHALQIGTWERDEHGRIRRGTWGQAYSGQAYYILDPRADEIHFADVCTGLAREPRYRGQTREFYSVAEHSVLVSRWCERLALQRGWLPGEIHEVACEGLFHDAPEAFIGDVARPLKKLRVMRGYKRIEARWWRATCERFCLAPTEASTALVEEVDKRIVLDEVEALLVDPDMWDRAGRTRGKAPLGARIEGLSWEGAAIAFAERFHELGLEPEMFS